MCRWMGVLGDRPQRGLVLGCHEGPLLWAHLESLASHDVAVSPGDKCPLHDPYLENCAYGL